MVSDFHLQAGVFFPGPKDECEWHFHSLDLKTALRLYLNGTQPGHKDPPPPGLLCQTKCWPQGFCSTSLQTECEDHKLCYLLAKWPLPGPIQAHSTRALATSFFKGISARYLHGSYMGNVAHFHQALHPQCSHSAADEYEKFCFGISLWLKAREDRSC